MASVTRVAIARALARYMEAVISWYIECRIRCPRFGLVDRLNSALTSSCSSGLTTFPPLYPLSQQADPRSRYVGRGLSETLTATEIYIAARSRVFSFL
jgi:hypothetical protein